VARGGGNSPSRQQEESRWRHASRHRVRTLLHEPAASRRSLLLMSSSCLCIAELICRLWQMQTTSRTPIAGVVTPAGGSSAGR
jgi:hypothetical protein